MNATKRKFNALLQGLGAARPHDSSSPTADQNDDSDPITASMAADLEFLSKRRRITAHGSPLSTKQQSASQSGAAPSPNGTISSVRLRHWTPGNNTGATKGDSSPSDAKSKDPPRYCPGDREQLLRRLATFQELTDWTPKPERVSEVEWAKKGWACRGRERVRCVLCERELVVKLNKKEVEGQEVSVLVASEIEDALVEKYVELMVTSHSEDCLWRKRGCDDWLLRVPVLNPKVVLSDLRLRYDELCVRKSSLPYEFNLSLPADLNIDKVLSYLPNDFFAETAPSATASTTATPAVYTPPAPNRVALALALLGWQGLTNPRIGPVPNSASCHTCLRRLGLWMFKSKEVDPATNAVLVPAPMDHLDPLREHRFFCPWKNGAAQRPGAGSGSGTKEKEKIGEAARPAWQLVLEMLRNEAHLRDRAAGGSGRGAGQHGRSKSNISVPGTPARPETQGSRAVTRDGPANGEDAPTLLVSADDDGDDDAASRDAKDKERWARLRKVKSFFNSKDAKKLKRLSRPGTGYSSIGGGGAS